LSQFLSHRTKNPFREIKNMRQSLSVNATAGFASSFFVSSRRQASVVLADGSHFVPFATVAIRSFVPLFTHCTLRPAARSRLFFHPQNHINRKLLMKKRDKEKPSDSQKPKKAQQSTKRRSRAP
jgi:hypothetical protein